MTSARSHVDEGITAYENLANIKVHSKKKTTKTSTSNHAVNSSSVSSFWLPQPSSVSGGVSASATLLQFLLLQRSNSVNMHSSSSFVSERAFTSLHCQSELMGSDLQVLDKLSDLDELSSLNPELNSLNHSASGSLNPSASAALCYNLCSCSVVDESDAHILYVYVAISIDNIVKLTTYKQAVKLPLCDK